MLRPKSKALNLCQRSGQIILWNRFLRLLCDRFSPPLSRDAAKMRQGLEVKLPSPRR